MAMRPAEVVLALSIKYLAPVTGTSKETRLMNLIMELNAMVISIVFSAAILLLQEDVKTGREYGGHEQALRAPWLPA